MFANEDQTLLTDCTTSLYPYYTITVKNGSCLFGKTIEKVIRLCTVSIFLSGSFEDIDIFHVFQLSFDGGRGYIYT